MIGDLLVAAYPWTKALHVISVIAWMAGLLYLPRLFVYHAERAAPGSELSKMFKVMERRLLKIIINPSGIAVWIFGLALVFTPGVIDWGNGWVHVKALMVIGMTVFQHMLLRWQREFERDASIRTGRYFRIANEVPTLMMVVIVVMVIARPF